MIEGTYFKDAFFPEKTLAALIQHPNVGIFEAEQAIFTTDEMKDLNVLFQFIFGTHENLINDGMSI